MSNTPRYTRLALALAATLSASTALAQQTQTQDQETSQATPSTSQNQQIERVVVTGSLIPQSEIETSTPVTIITAEDIQSRGLSTVAEVLKESSFSPAACRTTSLPPRSPKAPRR